MSCKPQPKPHAPKCWTVCGRKKALAVRAHAMVAAGETVAAVVHHAADHHAVTVTAKAMAARVHPSHAMIL
jgi:hypothetical protein